jgi:hypothetical protein
MGQVMTPQQHMDIISELALATGRPIDLIDLRKMGEPLLGQILKYGRRIMGSDVIHAQYMTRHIMDSEDFVPLQQRILQSTIYRNPELLDWLRNVCISHPIECLVR